MATVPESNDIRECLLPYEIYVQTTASSVLAVGSTPNMAGSVNDLWSYVCAVSRHMHMLSHGASPVCENQCWCLLLCRDVRCVGSPILGEPAWMHAIPAFQSGLRFYLQAPL